MTELGKWIPMEEVRWNGGWMGGNGVETEEKQKPARRRDCPEEERTRREEEVWNGYKQWNRGIRQEEGQEWGKVRGREGTQ